MNKTVKNITISKPEKKLDTRKEKLYFSTIRAYKYSMYERNKLKEFEKKILSKDK